MEIDKKHVFKFNTSMGVMTMGTDDLFELSSQDWFTHFLGVTRTRSAEQVRKVPVEKTFTTKEVKAIIARVHEERDEEEEDARILAEEAAQNLETDYDQQLPELPPEEEVRVVAEEMEQEMKAHQDELDRAPPPLQRPNIRADVPNVGQTNYLDITPNNMTEQIWVTLSPDQQAVYGKKYMPNS